MMKQYFDDMVAGIARKINDDPESRSPRKVYALEVARLGSRLYSGDGGVAWCGVTAPFDLLNAMGVTSCFVEFIGAMLAATGMADAYIDEAAHAGYAGDTCTYHRGVIGAMRMGLMPEPDFLIATSVPCTGGLAVMETIARHFKKDLFVLNVPQRETDESVKYLADQIRAMVSFVEDHTGRSLDQEKLQQAIDHTNEARALCEEAYFLARAVPSPADGRILSNFGVVMALLMGTSAGVEVARTYRDRFKEMVDSGQGGIADEKLRLLWIQNRIQFKNPLIDILEATFGASVVCEELNDITWDPIDPAAPFESMARRAISIPFNGDVNRRIAHLQKLAREYRIHGAINPCNWGCRQGTGARGLIAEGLKQIGVPVLNLEVDCIDSRNFALGQMQTRLEAFTEMLSG
ncbi:MAG: 2-hydroxyacyl-CoA dehydratase [Desulfobacteraceae bacterium]|jgi:benzoyl-CoA reductase/2-hydroxyglutaryl-CoA dehydratase subunit BcrC/BadD/HgdB|nr:MAG: 2-hydroxyacyl-CoA dehydratase [Desulfobacteraceae bacterium]